MDSYAWFLDLFNRVRALEVHAGIPSPDQAKAPGMEDTPAVCDMNHGPICIACGSLLVEAQAEAARLTRELAAERELRRQDAVRLVAAAENAGIPYGDCDTADDLAEALLCEKAAREKAEALLDYGDPPGYEHSCGGPGESCLRVGCPECEMTAPKLSAYAFKQADKAEAAAAECDLLKQACTSGAADAWHRYDDARAEAERQRPLGEAARRRIETPPCCEACYLDHGYDSDCECACHDRDREADARLRAALHASGEASQ